MIIAIDGPAASGKGTIAKQLSKSEHLPYLDTGLLYRAVGVLGNRIGFTPDDETNLSHLALNLDLDDIDKDELRSGEAGKLASQAAALPGVRKALLEFQRGFAMQEGGAILDGRDIATHIVPSADIKLFVTAAPEIRAQRRFKDLIKSGEDITEAQVLADILERDRRDSERSTAPMQIADDAHLIDTSNLSIEEAFAHVLDIVRKAQTSC